MVVEIHIDGVEVLHSVSFFSIIVLFLGVCLSFGPLFVVC